MKDDFKIYLSGKMTGLNKLEMNSWRQEFAQKIGDDWFAYSKTPHVINPCEFFTDDPAWAEHKEYVRLELRCARDCDLIVVLVSKDQDSIGTACELTMAYEHGKPALLYNPYKIPHEEIHPFVWEMSDRCFEELETMTDYIREVYLV